MHMPAEEIHNLYLQRQKSQGPLLAQMAKMRSAANYDLIVPLNELSRNEKASVANLLVQGLDQTSMRIASTMPSPFFPPIRDGSDRSKGSARMRKRATLAMWDENRMGMKLRRRTRHLLAYSLSGVSIRPNFKTLVPEWNVRNPLDTFPAPLTDPDHPVPDDCIFSYTITANQLKHQFPEQAAKLRLGKITGDTRVTMLEYLSADYISLVAIGTKDDPYGNVYENLGQETVMLESLPNRTGMPLAVVANRVTLDKPRGQFDDMISMYYSRARLQALTEIAIERGIFPAEYLVARAGETPVVITTADPQQGILGVVKGGDIQQYQINPGYKTDTALDRMERQERLEGAIPAEFGGESSTGVRTGRRGDAVLSAGVDYRVQEAQATFEQSLREENKIAIAIEKAYWGDTSKSFFLPGKQKEGQSTYVPNKIWETDKHYVSYSSAGSDVNSLTVMIGQMLGTKLISEETARESHPMIADPELEHDRIQAEGIEAAVFASFQQQAADPNGPYQPRDLAQIAKYVLEEDLPLYTAIARAQQAAQDRQASVAAPGSPETQLGLSTPGLGTQQPGGPPAGQPSMEALMAQLGG